MNKLLEENISWKDIEGSARGKMECDLEDAFISKETGVLMVRVGLNFVVPVKDDKSIKKALKASVPGLSGVELIYDYHKDDLVMDRDEMIRLFIGRLATAGDNAIRNAIKTDNIMVDGDDVTVHSLGKLATDRLNKDFAMVYEGKLKDAFGIKVNIEFRNDEEGYKATAKSLKEKPLEISRPRKSAPKSSSPGKSKSSGTITGGRIMGKKITGEPMPLSDLAADTGKVVVSGTLFKKEARAIKNDKRLVTLLITDKKTSACLKAFTKADKWEEMNDALELGDYIVACGETEWNRFENCLDVMVRDIEKSSAPHREDTYAGKKRVELHCHTKMSAMDGLNDAEQLVKTAAGWGQPAVAITDHGVVQSFPDAANTAAKLGKNGHPIKILYGMEGYVFGDSDCHNQDGSIDYKKNPTYHIILLARTQEGLKNIYKLVSLSHLDYFYRRPRLPKSLIQEHRAGIIIGSACEAGEVYQAVLHNNSDERCEKIADFYDYMEIQPLVNNRFMIEENILPDYEALKEVNRKVVALADRMGKPIVATTDAHYDEPESAIYRNILMAGMGFKDAENGQGLYMRTTNEMLDEFSYLGEDTAYRVVVENTNKIADMIDDGIKPVPDGKYPPRIEGAEDTLRTTCMDRAHEIYGDPLPDVIEDRLDTELNAIINNGYAVMYVSAQMLVHKSLSDGYLVGSRGSVGSSLAATMAGITEVNPLEPHYICPECKHLEWGDMNLYDCGIDMPEKACPECGTMMKRDGFTIPFATFLGFNGDKEPDIDLNFAGEYQARAHKYVGEIFGEKNVYKAGTVGTIADKTAYGYVMKYFEETGRAGNKFEADRLASGCTGVKRTTGQHPGGIIIVPDDHEIYEFCPVQHPANDVKSDIVTTHFDYHKIDKNLLKLDILGHNIPSMIRQLQDMTGKDPLTVDLTDRKVLSIFNGIEALDIKDKNYKYTHGTYAIPEFGTSFVRQMLDDTKPDKFADLVRISGFSHGTDVWLNNAQDYIRSGTATMREVISTRDDIMNYLILKGIEKKTSFQIMEDVRKNRPLKDEQLAVMKEHDVPDWYIDSCIKIQYMFPRAHAVAYVMMSFRMAWYKVYYPAEFYATYFTSVQANFDVETILKGPQACLDRIAEINIKGNNATAKDKDDILVLEVAYEMYARGYEFADARLGASHALKFWVEDGKVLLPFVAFDGVGENAAKALADAYNEKPFDTVEDAVTRARLTKSAVEVLRAHGIFEGLPETDQLTWAL
ncbi:PolC-type DNA polymerase III [Aminicella lysinilytica]|uniref:DNA polymerase III PolC-type n=1 Tax=Aminicella lysinilytica TaxID=433323 RepID=A0A4R6QE05_9FIRM|nr:PolC-type DNA polymerase III [Aminicella lysinilytica]TDP59669.1 DNA polymerase-3 subunit alpha (Gram-positive type) [Aminicella lysinilytica]